MMVYRHGYGKKKRLCSRQLWLKKKCSRDSLCEGCNWYTMLRVSEVDECKRNCFELSSKTVRAVHRIVEDNMALPSPRASPRLPLSLSLSLSLPLPLTLLFLLPLPLPLPLLAVLAIAANVDVAAVVAFSAAAFVAVTILPLPLFAVLDNVAGVISSFAAPATAIGTTAAVANLAPAAVSCCRRCYC